MQREKVHHKKRYFGKIVLYAFLIVMVIYTLIPFFTIILTSFRTTKDSVRGPFTLPQEWDFIGNYAEAWEMGNFSTYLFNSIYMMIFTVALTLVVATLAGYSFAKFKYPGKNVLYYILIFSMMIPFQTIMLPEYFVLRKLGLLNSLTGVAIVMTATGIGFAVMMMRSFFVGIPDSMIEAARIDGCGELKILTSIILPNTYPAWSSLIIFVALGAWNNLLAPMIYIVAEEKYPIPYAMYAFQDSHGTSYGLMSAAMMISVLPIAILYLCFAKRFQANIMAGSVKG